MKKTIAMLLLVCSMCLVLGACSADRGYEKGKTFSTEFLKSVSLENMPLPEFEDYALNNRAEGQETMRIKTDLKSFEAYINSFIEYMNARDDIYYFGIQKEDGWLGEMIPHEVAHKIDGDFEWESGYLRYTFAYSLTDELERNDYACSTHIQYKGTPALVDFGYDKEDQVATMTITTNGAFATECIRSELTGFGKHSITYEDNVGALYPDYQPTLSADSDNAVTIRISKNMNDSIQVKVIYSAEVSKILSCSATHEDFCEYSFDMPAHNVTVVIENNPDKIANTGTETGDQKEDFNYSTAIVTSENETVNPIQCLLWTNQYVNGENTLCGDGEGYHHLVIIEADHNALPTLTLKGSVIASSTSVGSSVSQSVRIYSTDFEEIQMNSNFKELSELSVGEYIIVFEERTDTRCGDESIKDYWLSGFDCVFKLIVVDKQ